MDQNFDTLISELRNLRKTTLTGSIVGLSSGRVDVAGLGRSAKIGDMVEFRSSERDYVLGEILSLKGNIAKVLPESGISGLALNESVKHRGPIGLFPCEAWVGRVIDPLLRPLDGRNLPMGSKEVALKSAPPVASQRGKLGQRIATGMNGFDTLLPIVEGQRIGLFAGSGVGKSTLLADLAKGMEADVVVVSLIGERGRELREFIEETLGPDGMSRSVIIAATADQSAMLRRRAAWVAMSTAEFLRDNGKNVLFLMDSVTRFAEAHREIATSVGEPLSVGGFPASTAQELMTLSERAGPGPSGGGNITGVFSVLVAGSDMEGHLADVMRGTLDGHVVLERSIAERGRFPAIDYLKSVSRSLSHSASEEEIKIISAAKSLLSAFSESELLIQAGLYQPGSSSEIDQAIRLRPALELFFSGKHRHDAPHAFSKLNDILNEKIDGADLT